MTTLDDLILRIRQRADKVNSLFVTDSEITAMVNSSYAELYDLITQTAEDYFTTSLSFTLSSSDAGVYTLPGSFYKLRGVDFLLGGSYITLYPYDWIARNDDVGPGNQVLSQEFAYKIMGTTLRFVPEDLAVGTFRLWYIPAYTPLSSGSDVISTQITKQNWEEYLVLDVAKKILDKEESNTSTLLQDKEILRRRITEFASGRDIDQPMRVSYSRARRSTRRWWW